LTHRAILTNNKKNKNFQLISTPKTNTKITSKILGTIYDFLYIYIYKPTYLTFFMPPILNIIKLKILLSMVLANTSFGSVFVYTLCPISRITLILNCVSHCTSLLQVSNRFFLKPIRNYWKLFCII